MASDEDIAEAFAKIGMAPKTIEYVDWSFLGMDIYDAADV